MEFCEVLRSFDEFLVLSCELGYVGVGFCGFVGLGGRLGARRSPCGRFACMYGYCRCPGFGPPTFGLPSSSGVLNY